MARQAVRQISENVIVVSAEGSVKANPTLILDEKRFSFYRGGAPGQGLPDAKSDLPQYCYLAVPPSRLRPEETRLINKYFDGEEGHKNKLVKQEISQALGRFFNDQAFHMTEIGPGQYPIAPYLSPHTQFTYHGIENDPDHVATLSRMNISASDWTGLPVLPPGKPAVCVSVYALRFLIGPKLPGMIEPLISRDGFFVGNLHRTAEEFKTQAEERALDKILGRSNLKFIKSGYGDQKHAQYWIIGKASNVGDISEFAQILETSYTASRYRQSIRSHDRPFQPS